MLAEVGRGGGESRGQNSAATPTIHPMPKERPSGTVDENWERRTSGTPAVLLPCAWQPTSGNIAGTAAGSCS